MPICVQQALADAEPAHWSEERRHKISTPSTLPVGKQDYSPAQYKVCGEERIIKKAKRYCSNQIKYGYKFESQHSQIK